MNAVLRLSPLETFLARAEGFKPSGRGYRGPCASCGGKSAKVSVTEADNGSLLLHAFCGCAPTEVLGAMGMTLADLFPQRLTPMTEAEQRQSRERVRMVGWQAALEVLCKEAAIVHLAQQQLARWQILSEEDDARLRVAEERIANARNVLCPPLARFRPEVTHG